MLSLAGEYWTQSVMSSLIWPDFCRFGPAPPTHGFDDSIDVSNTSFQLTGQLLYQWNALQDPSFEMADQGRFSENSTTIGCWEVLIDSSSTHGSLSLKVPPNYRGCHPSPWRVDLLARVSVPLPWWWWRVTDASEAAISPVAPWPPTRPPLPAGDRTRERRARALVAAALIQASSFKEIV